MAMVISGLDTFKGWLGSLDRFLGTIKSSRLSNVLQGISGSLSETLGRLDLNGLLKQALNDIGTAIAATDWRAVGTFIGTSVVTGIKVLRGILTDPGIWSEALAVLGQAVLAVVKIVGGSLEVAGASLKADIGSLFQAFTSGTTSIVTAVTTKIGEVLGYLKGLWDNLISKIQGFASGILDTPGSAIGSVVGSVARSSLGTAATAISPLATAIVQKAAQVFSPTINSAVSVQAQTNADPDSIGRAASAHIGSEYRKYAQGSLK
jgi:hypothetical protein